MEPKTKHYKKEKQDKISREDMTDAELLIQTDEETKDVEMGNEGGYYPNNKEQTKQEFGTSWD
jgi:hypothetical protein